MPDPPLPRFAWYDRLSAAQKRIYRKSDSIVVVPLRDAARIRTLVPPLRAALDAGDRLPVQAAARKLMRALVTDLEVPPLKLSILDVRPRDARSELHGLYTWEPPEPAEIQVWMRTAVNERVVAFKSFLRTILHELCHHLDYHRFALGDSLHTRGFYARESSICGQILVDDAERPRKPEQLRLPGF
ncbi:MAG: hypothetical protein QM820_57840 [Minicystis sp.]